MKTKVLEKAAGTSKRGNTGASTPAAQPKSQGKQAKRIRRVPLVDGRLDEVLTIAADVFVEQGFDRASYDEICRRASTSKGSLYDRYPTKEDLFRNVLDHRMRSVAQGMSMDEFDPAMPVAEALQIYGLGMLTSVLSDAQVELIRTISSVVPRFPDLGQRFFSLGPAFGMRTLTDFLANKIKRGELKSNDAPQDMTRLFINMATDGLLYRKLLGVAKPQTKQEQKAQIARAVAGFLRLYSTSE